MHNIISIITKFVFNRVVRNILFWAFIFWFTLENKTYAHTYPESWYWFFIGITTALMLILTYVNNLLLVPRLLHRRKYFLYLLSMLAHVAVMSILYIVVLKSVLTKLPVMHLQQISMISGYVTKEWSLDAVLVEAQTYYFGFFWWVVIFTMAWYVNDYAGKLKEIEEIKQKQIETELNFLKSQINPHFLFNTLNNLYALALKKSDAAPEAILKLSSLLRYMLYDATATLVNFDREKELMEAYIDLELLRIADKSALNFHIQADENYKIPPLLWLPVLENAFKHGTRYIADQYYIDYDFCIKKNILKIISKNRFKTIQERKDNTGQGIGLSNLRKRLELVYPSRHQIETKTEDDFYCIYITISLQ